MQAVGVQLRIVGNIPNSSASPVLNTIVIKHRIIIIDLRAGTIVSPNDTISGRPVMARQSTAIACGIICDGTIYQVACAFVYASAIAGANTVG